MMDTNKLKTAKTIALAIASVITVLAMLRAAAWHIELGTLGFIGWAISPYVCYFAATVLLEKFTSHRQVSKIFCVGAFLMLGLTLLAYVGTLGDSSSTYALIFIFVPLYLFVGSFFIIGVAMIWLLFKRLIKKGE